MRHNPQHLHDLGALADAVFHHYGDAMSQAVFPVALGPSAARQNATQKKTTSSTAKKVKRSSSEKLSYRQEKYQEYVKKAKAGNKKPMTFAEYNTYMDLRAQERRSNASKGMAVKKSTAVKKSVKSTNK